MINCLDANEAAVAFEVELQRSGLNCTCMKIPASDGVDLQLGDLVSSIWINFAKAGNPNGAGLPTWPAFDASTQVLLNFSDHPKAEKAPFGAELDFQDKVAAVRRR